MCLSTWIRPGRWWSRTAIHALCTSREAQLENQHRGWIQERDEQPPFPNILLHVQHNVGDFLSVGCGELSVLCCGVQGQQHQRWWNQQVTRIINDEEGWLCVGCYGLQTGHTSPPLTRWISAAAVRTDTGNHLPHITLYNKNGHDFNLQMFVMFW